MGGLTLRAGIRIAPDVCLSVPRTRAVAANGPTGELSTPPAVEKS
jgi:hypothetical protein